MSNLDEIAEAELENFRKQWREEVYARNRRPAHLRDKAPEGDAHSRSRPALQSARSGGPSTARRTDVKDYSEEVEPRTYHDLPNNEERMKLGADGEYHDRNIHMEPESALEHYERAVEKETQGNLGESLRHYRTAFKVRLPISNDVLRTCTELSDSLTMASMKPTRKNTSLHRLSSSPSRPTSTLPICLLPYPVPPITPCMVVRVWDCRKRSGR